MSILARFKIATEAVLLLPFILRSILLSTKSNYLTPYRVFQAYKILYLLSRGYIEILARILLPPLYCQKVVKQNSLVTASSSLIKYGYAELSLDIHPLVTDFLENSHSLPFQSRCTGETILFQDLSINASGMVGRYDAVSSNLFANTSFAKIVTSAQIRNLAFSLFGKNAVITSALAWASFPTFDYSSRSLSSQVYHVDFDFIDDIKIFILLSGSSKLNGPIEYIAESHKPWKHKIFSLSGISDSDVQSCFDKSRICYFTGSAGSSFISNNRGIHRDYPPSVGHYKVDMQINLARSRFGDEYTYLKLLKTRPMLSVEAPSYNVWRDAITRNSMLYSLLFADPIAK